MRSGESYVVTYTLHFIFVFCFLTANLKMATSLSHLTLSTPSPTMLRDSLTFYAALGFKTLSVRRATVNGYADCVVECLLRNFNECPTLCELTLKIVLDENSMKEFNSDEYVKKKKEKEGKIADQPSLFSLSCDRILVQSYIYPYIS